MSSTMFKKATKTQAKARLALTGPSGAGKTLSALLIAKGMGGRTAVLDTENGSASLYADRFGEWTYDVVSIAPPFTAQKYFNVMRAAITEKYDNLIIDSSSHMWAGEGGLLTQKDALDSRGGNSFTNWNSITKVHEEFKSMIVQSPIHIITTMRSKQEYILETNEKGKQTPRKVGMAPIQREGMEYEFTVVFDIGMDHQFVASKDRTGLFDGVIAKITEETGRQIIGWLSAGAVEVAQPVSEPGAPTTNEPSTEAPVLAPPNETAYVITFGKYVNKTLSQVPAKELMDYVKFLKDMAKKDNKPIRGQVATFIGEVEALLGVPSDPERPIT